MVKNIIRIAASLALLLCTMPAIGQAKGDLLKLVLSKDMPQSALHFSYDAYCPNVVYIVHSGWQNAIFDIHIFEDLVVPAKNFPAVHFVNNRKIDERLFEWTKDGNGYKYHIRQTELINFEMRGTIRPAGNQVIIEGQITNLDQYKWNFDYAIGLMCFRCRNNPDFRDFNGERIWVYEAKTGAPHTIDSVAGHTSKYFNFFLAKNNGGPYAAKLKKSNKTLTRSVIVESSPVRTLLGNREDGICCVHTNFGLAAATGETVNYREVITFEDSAPMEDWCLYE